jgi:hypothetical protein
VCSTMRPCVGSQASWATQGRYLRSETTSPDGISAYRLAAAAALSALAANVSDKQAIGAAAAGMLDVLDGKAAGGKPKSAPERSGMLAGLQALAAAPSSSASMHEIAEPVVQRLLSAYRAEANEEVRRLWPLLAGAGARMQEHGMVVR